MLLFLDAFDHVEHDFGAKSRQLRGHICEKWFIPSQGNEISAGGRFLGHSEVTVDNRVSSNRL